MDSLMSMLSEHVYLILFISLILEFVALPIPGETMMLFAGIMGYNGHANYVFMIIAAALGTIIGMQFSYEVGRRLGSRAVKKYGKYIGLTYSRIDNATKFFNKYGNIVIIIAYFLPGVRHILGYFSGISRIDAKKFHIYSTLGGIFWVATFITAGYILGPTSTHIFLLFHKYGTLLVILALSILFIYLIYKKIGKELFLNIAKKRFINIIVFFIANGILSYFVTRLFFMKKNKIVLGKFLYDYTQVFLVILLLVVFLLFVRINLKNITSKKLLVVVDYQKDFVDGSLGFPGASELDEKIAKRIKEYLDNNEDVIFTLDTHHSNYLQTREARHIPIEHCIKDTKGYLLYGKVSEYKKYAKKVFEKESFASIELAKFIQRSDYEEVEFCGLVSNICVLSNIILTQNYNLDAEIYVDLELVRSNDEKINKTLEEYLKALCVNIKNKI